MNNNLNIIHIVEELLEAHPYIGVCHDLARGMLTGSYTNYDRATLVHDSMDLLLWVTEAARSRTFEVSNNRRGDDPHFTKKSRDVLRLIYVKGQIDPEFTQDVNSYLTNDEMLNLGFIPKPIRSLYSNTSINPDFVTAIYSYEVSDMIFYLYITIPGEVKRQCQILTQDKAGFVANSIYYYAHEFDSALPLSIEEASSKIISKVNNHYLTPTFNKNAMPSMIKELIDLGWVYPDEVQKRPVDLSFLLYSSGITSNAGGFTIATTT